MNGNAEDASVFVLREHRFFPYLFSVTLWFHIK